jgi:hypothetical protein
MTAKAIMVGDMSACTEPILSSLAREATEQLLNETANAIEEEHRLTVQRQRAESRARADAIQTLCDGISRMDRRLDSLERQRREEAREARRRARADIEASLPDPEYPPEIPGVNPGNPPRREPGETSFQYEDAATGVLPQSLEQGAPPGIGEYAEFEPENSAHPQKPIPQTPTAIGGP